MVEARIYKPAKTAMQSGHAASRNWCLEFEPKSGPQQDPMMGWAGWGDTRQQVRLKFRSRDAAEAYAQKAGLEYRVQTQQTAKRRLKSYADNFR
jgi:hypothetical protein